MKRLYSIILMVFALIVASSCDKPQEEVIEKTKTFTIKESSLRIPAKGGEATISYVAEQAVEVVIDKDWCTFTDEDSVVVITATENLSFESRYAKATLSSAGEKYTFTIQQSGYASSGFEPEDISISKAAFSTDFAYMYDDVMVASCEAEWVKLTITEDNLHVEIAENSTMGSIDYPTRDAEISWKLGVDSGVIKVSQKNLSYMKEDSNWRVYYDGIKPYEGEDAAYIYNEVTDPTLSGKYSIYYVDKASFEESGLEFNEFMQELADALKAEIQSLVALYNAFGYNLTFADFLYEDTDFEIFDPMDPGDYIAVAVGFTDDAKVTGHYASSEFTVTSTGGDSGATGYEAWLGEWEVERGTAKDTWVISAATSGATYTITGIEGRNYPVTATYLADSNQIEVRAQSEIGTYNSSNYGECSVGLYGGWDTSSFATGTYVIFTGKISGDKATLTPGVVSFSDGSSYTLERVQYVATTSEGKYLTITKDKTPLPTTLTRKGGSGGGDSGATSGYKKFIGTWSVDGGAFDMSLSQKTADKSYDMLGWQMMQDFFSPVEVTYEENGTITLYGDDYAPIATGVDIGAEEGTCRLVYVGNFIHSDGKEYYITSGGKGAYDVATGTLQSDGSIVFTGNKFKSSDGGDYTFTRYQILAIAESDPEVIYSFKSKPNTFPLTATKAGSSSIKSLSQVISEGEWVRTDIRNANMLFAAEEICTPFQALPEIPVRCLRHIAK